MSNGERAMEPFDEFLQVVTVPEDILSLKEPSGHHGETDGEQVVVLTQPVTVKTVRQKTQQMYLKVQLW